MKIKFAFLLIALSLVLGCSSNEDDNQVANGSNRSLNLQPTGSSANDFLSDTRYRSLAIEVVYVEGFRPEAQTLTNLRNFINARLHKPDGVTITEREIPSPGLAPYDINEVAQLETTVRTKYNFGNILTLYLFFADGGTTTDTQTNFTLGTAYRNTSFVMYEQNIREWSDGVGEANRVDLETTVIQHEMGHLLGLVNLGSLAQSAHEDNEHMKHCVNQSCLMYWQAETNALLGMMLGGNVPQLDAACLADLRANGGK